MINIKLNNKLNSPFFYVNPKAYLCGENLLTFAQNIDPISKGSGKDVKDVLNTGADAAGAASGIFQSDQPIIVLEDLISAMK
ncbi:MAG: hypothetical protein ABR596_02150 [Halarsenatibacteraceae bacterium]